MKTIEVKTAELIGPALDWAVAKADGREIEPSGTDLYLRGQYHGITHGEYLRTRRRWSPSADWAQGGPLVDKLMSSGKWELVPWFGGVLFQNYTSECIPVDGQSWDVQSVLATGKTVLIAACRAIVAAKLGDVVSVPAELALPTATI